MPFIPHTDDDIKAMLDTLALPSLDTLFDEIPQHLRYHGFQSIPHGMSEMSMLQHAETLAHQNQTLHCFIGAGSYAHHIPAAVWDIASRGEFLTAYTPYQAEASQGTLQLLYEFQTLIATLTGMDVANASLYDGASSLAEAVLMTLRLQREKSSPHRILVPASLHPYYRQALHTITHHTGIEIITLPIDPNKGTTCLKTLQTYREDYAALIIPQPNFFGALEPVDELCDIAHENEMFTIACVNPISLGLLKPPSDWGQHGVDIVCGEGQPLGAPLASGGPYFGFLSTRQSYVRQMPGRLIGATVDREGQRGFTLTLQAREQHIRRGKATSNICTNQGLLVVAATIHMCLLGPQGLSHVAHTCHQRTRELVEALTQLKGVHQIFNTTPYFHEVVIQYPTPIQPLIDALLEDHIIAGFPLENDYPNLSQCLLVCATEKTTPEAIQAYVTSLTRYLSRSI